VKSRLSVLERFKNFHLFVFLALLVLGWPFIIGGGRVFLVLLVVFVMLSSIAACATRKIEVLLGLLIGGVIAAGMLFGGNANRQISAGSSLLALSFFSYTALLLLREVFLRTETVSSNTLYGAASAYLLIGIAWAEAFTVLELLEPGSFIFPASASHVGGPDISRFLGFSFVTLTTLGYGNIVPATSRAESLAIGEAIVGQLYVAMLLSRLVAMHLAASRRASPD